MRRIVLAMAALLCLVLPQTPAAKAQVPPTQPAASRPADSQPGTGPSTRPARQRPTTRPASTQPAATRPVFPPVGPPKAAAPLPRVAIADGRFVLAGPGKAQPFFPRGMNYARLYEGKHYTFSSVYDPAACQFMLDEVSSRGFNVVRVFISMDYRFGVGAGAADGALAPAYIARVIDFLARARAAGIHVIFAMEGPPNSPRYLDMVEDNIELPFEGNMKYLHVPAQDAKARYIGDFVTALATRAPDLLSTVMAYELENEVTFNFRAAPFSIREGTFELAGQHYDMTSETELQRLADDGFKMTADKCVAAVRKVDPKALVSGDVYTFKAVGRSGPNKLLTDRSRGGRFPARPLAMVDTKLDYIDIHLYGVTEEALADDLASIEWPVLQPAAARAGKPIIMGEFGAFRGKLFPDAATAAEGLIGHVRRVMDAGFAGWLLWTYDSDEQPSIFNAKMDGGMVMEAMTAALKIAERRVPSGR